MQNIIFVLLTTFFVSSCNTIVRKATCDAIDSYQVEDTYSYVYNKGHCYQAPFDVNSWQISEEYAEVELKHCDSIQGVKVKFGVDEIHPKFKALQRLRAKSCR